MPNDKAGLPGGAARPGLQVAEGGGGEQGAGVVAPQNVMVGELAEAGGGQTYGGKVGEIEVGDDGKHGQIWEVGFVVLLLTLGGFIRLLHRRGDHGTPAIGKCIHFSSHFERQHWQLKGFKSLSISSRTLHADVGGVD